MKKKISIVFPPEITEEPITYTMIKKYDLKINILRASIGYNTKGNLLVEISGREADIADAISYIESLGLNVSSLGNRIIRDEERCVSCGACTAVCPTAALYMDENWKLVFDAEKCVGCKLCISACPLRVIKEYE